MRNSMLQQRAHMRCNSCNAYPETTETTLRVRMLSSGAWADNYKERLLKQLLMQLTIVGQTSTAAAL